MNYWGRREPYMERGISRVPCARCGEPSAYQWQICANGSRWLGVCAGCDVAMNWLIAGFFGLPAELTEAYEKLRADG